MAVVINRLWILAGKHKLLDLHNKVCVRCTLLKCVCKMCVCTLLMCVCMVLMWAGTERFWCDHRF